MSINDLTPDQNQDTEIENQEELKADELSILKQRARMMGITVSNNIGLDTLKKKIADHQEGKKEDSPVKESKVNPLVQENTVVSKGKKGFRQQMLLDQMKLVRVRIQNLNENKKDLPGEIFTVANRYIGSVRKYIPYNDASDSGYHIPYCIYQLLKDKKFLSIRTLKGKNGTPKVETRMAREFAIEVLPPLTSEELAKLAQAQIAAGSTKDD